MLRFSNGVPYQFALPEIIGSELIYDAGELGMSAASDHVVRVTPIARLLGGGMNDDKISASSLLLLVNLRR
ncbi:hypothetical protein GWI33_018757 [Rhynchophorus ferrugineus]|uniref:Uncharacterized protein n=1 Tax=Rhynchophorus ferrugineus TaxID=354439 RepID=A0A834HU95_RHYFE|nr:hypothetical protein GWI33_018757 [Rhynchophorus ferrugineus]